MRRDRCAELLMGATAGVALQKTCNSSPSPIISSVVSNACFACGELSVPTTHTIGSGLGGSTTARCFTMKTSTANADAASDTRDVSRVCECVCTRAQPTYGVYS